VSHPVPPRHGSHTAVAVLHLQCCDCNTVTACTGPLPVDKEVYSQLMATGQFEQMPLDVDEVRQTCGVQDSKSKDCS
jgi:hypothetical protein